MLGMSGVWEWVIIGGIVVLLFGVKKIPMLGGAVGEGIRNFKKGIKDGEKVGADDDNPEKLESANDQAVNKPAKEEKAT